MPRSTSIIARERADSYATRAVLIELLRHLKQIDPQIIPAIRSVTQRGILRPIDVIVSEQDVRESFEAILAEV